MVEVEVDEIGPSLRYATAKVNKASHNGGGGGSGSGGGGGAVAPDRGRPAAGPADDPVGQRPASGSFGGADDEPPF